jgi:tetratricopeptide (TPR) repeat protein
MTVAQIFVSHSSTDAAFTRMLVTALTAAGADVWYDERNLGHGILLDEITKQIGERTIFIVVLSKAAFASSWVRDECSWAYNLYRRRPTRVILPVVATQIDPGDFNTLLFMEGFVRIEGPNHRPFSRDESIRRTLNALALDSRSQRGFTPTSNTPYRTEDYLVYGKALNTRRQFAESELFLEHATRTTPTSKGAWGNYGFALDNLKKFPEALRAYDKSLSIDPTQAWIWFNKSLILETLGQLKEALRAIERAVSLDNLDAKAWERQGDLLTKLGQDSDAQRSYDRARLLSRIYPN